MTPIKTDKIFICYPVFKGINQIIFFSKKNIAYKSLFITFFLLSLIVLSSFLDHSLILPGRDIGLIEHPVIWSFIIIQAVIPFSVNSAVTELSNFFSEKEIINSEVDLSYYVSLLHKQVSRNTNLSRVLYFLLVITGFICFVWNSYQNQLPFKFLGCDFWDSIIHTWGYWITRVYKLFLWGVFFPSVIHIQLSILIVLNKLLKNAIAENFFKLNPYHQDDHGGFGKLIKIIINPFIPILVIASVAVLCVLLKHGRLDITSIIGLCILSFLFIVIYFVPALALRRVIKFEKKRQLGEITHTQNGIFYSLLKNNISTNIHEKIETLNGLDPISKQIKDISNWPYLSMIVKIIGIVNTPVLIDMGKKVLPILNSIFGKINISH